MGTQPEPGAVGALSDETRVDLDAAELGADPGESESVNLGELLESPAALADQLVEEWQKDLESGLEAIDSRLVRRRPPTGAPATPVRAAAAASDVPPAPRAASGGYSPELLDELAWRVTERLRASGQLHPPPAAEDGDAEPGWAISIRIRRPLFSLPRLLDSRRRHRRRG